MIREVEPSRSNNKFYPVRSESSPQADEKEPDISDIQITSRQKEILQLAAHGLSTKEIAIRIKLSVYTVNKDFGSIYSKLRKAGNLDFTPNYVGIMIFAYRRGLIQTSELEESARLVGTLSSREQEVLALLVTGISDKEIAQKLGISIFTANKHVSHVHDKLGVGSRQGAALRLAIYKDMQSKEAQEKQLSFIQNRLLEAPMLREGS